MMSQKKCCTCKKQKSLSEFVKSRKTKDGYGWRCKECHNKAERESRIKNKKLPEYETYLKYLRDWKERFKKECIRYKGGKCSVCGYDKCVAALDFHHINPTEKDFKIGKGRHVLDDIMERELDKCILICTNCHRELHYLAKRTLGQNISAS